MYKSKTQNNIEQFPTKIQRQSNNCIFKLQTYFNFTTHFTQVKPLISISNYIHVDGTNNITDEEFFSPQSS